MDGQTLDIDREGNVLLVAGGNRRGKEAAQFSESTNLSSNSKAELIVADTQVARATLLTPPGRLAKT